jgi:hypothetical protein
MKCDSDRDKMDESRKKKCLPTHLHGADKRIYRKQTKAYASNPRYSAMFQLKIHSTVVKSCQLDNCPILVYSFLNMFNWHKAEVLSMTIEALQNH